MGTTEAAANLSFQLIFGIVGMLLLTGFIIIFFVVYQRRLLQQQLHLQQIEADYQKELLNSGILAQEEERSRIAAELHDSIGGLLSATKIYVSNVSQELPEEKFELFKSKALITLNENIGEVRTITNDLLPQSLERLGVVTAVRGLTQKLIDLKQIRVSFDANFEERFEKNKEKALFRILQELINNTLKHSTASAVIINFDLVDKKLKVLYKEDGQGFDRLAYENQQDRKSFGLKSMESRMAFLNGEFNYQTAPGKGVEVRFSFML